MSSGFLFIYTLAELQSTTQSSFKLKFNSTLTVFIVNKSAFFIFQNRPCFTAAFLPFSPCHNPLCYSAKLSKSSAVNYLVNSFFSYAVYAEPETQDEHKDRKFPFKRVFVCEQMDWPSTLPLSAAQSKQGRGGNP